MITISESASTELEGFFSDKEKETIRIYLSGGCGGPRLALALDAASDADETYTQSGFTFCIDKELAASLGDVHMDLTPMGFAVESTNPLPEGGGGGCGCGSSCGCGGSCAS